MAEDQVTVNGIKYNVPQGASVSISTNNGNQKVRFNGRISGVTVSSGDAIVTNGHSTQIFGNVNGCAIGGRSATVQTSTVQTSTVQTSTSLNIADSNGNINCVDCIECYNCKDCTDCKNCVNCTDCTDCVGCYNCKNCTDCKNCKNCTECNDCRNSNNLKNCDG